MAACTGTLPCPLTIPSLTQGGSPISDGGRGYVRLGHVESLTAVSRIPLSLFGGLALNPLCDLGLFMCFCSVLIRLILLARSPRQSRAVPVGPELLLFSCLLSAYLHVYIFIRVLCVFVNMDINTYLNMCGSSDLTLSAFYDHFPLIEARPPPETGAH